MRQLKPVLMVIALTMALVAGGTASADRYSGGGGHKGSYHGGGSYRGGYYHGWSGYRGDYYRGRVGVVIGGPYWGQPWYYPPYYYPYSPYYSPYYSYPSVVVPSSPPVYIERPQFEADSPPQGVWYYCPDSKAYYPYVKECPNGWQTVPAQPPSGKVR